MPGVLTCHKEDEINYVYQITDTPNLKNEVLLPLVGGGRAK